LTTWVTPKQSIKKPLPYSQNIEKQAKGKIAFNKHCITLVGTQNDGKTSFVRFLCPPALERYIKQNPDVNKDGIISLAQNFIVNWDEVDKLSKADVATVKALMTLDKINERLPYGRSSVQMERNANFFATTNKIEFLTDETGNVRWLPIVITGINHDNGGANGYVQNCDINGIWAQALALLNDGHESHLTKDEIQFLEKMNARHIKFSYEMELINDRFAIGSKDDDFMNAAQIVDYLSGGLSRKINHTQVGKALQHLGFERVARWDAASRESKRGYFVKKSKWQGIKR
jgi:predicted P-loop ATPase